MPAKQLSFATDSMTAAATLKSQLPFHQSVSGRDQYELCYLGMSLQRLVDSEARQRQADDALLKGTASAHLLQVPVWSACLTPGQSQATGRKLQGTLTIPKDCSVRLMRRMFAQTIQVT